MGINKVSNEKVDDYFERIVKEGYKPNLIHQNINKQDIEIVLDRLGRMSLDMIDVVWCLLDNEFPSLFNINRSISDGATVAHIGGYVGIYLRHGKRLDREGRDYWIKPLIEIGAIEEITLKGSEFEHGHLKAKSPNSAYRLTSEFVNLLNSTNEPFFEQTLQHFMNTIDKRLKILAELRESNEVVSAHKQLILDSIRGYARHFLPGYISVFTDYEDGNRVTDKEREQLNRYGIVFGTISDVWPDAILFNPQTNSLWFIEAVTSDGEADVHKMQGLLRICQNSNKHFGGVTTTYETWKRLAARQKKEKNLVQQSYVWIKEDPTKQFFVC
ncbi:BsuBI/PstI family type II restriction endonuclease [Enterocloster bolteae]|uniref:BsuBI/PstI family type II restriction endonuclease n=1 Tax=Enterocloster bolteae TaxID=208479 RepID=UPI002676DB0A|nr:BsuBI/PstI family type II restriction endonuclease [Enterocloster bolteae]